MLSVLFQNNNINSYCFSYNKGGRRKLWEVTDMSMALMVVSVSL